MGKFKVQSLLISNVLPPFGYFLRARLKIRISFDSSFPLDVISSNVIPRGGGVRPQCYLGYSF